MTSTLHILHNRNGGELRFGGEDSNQSGLYDRCCIHKNTVRHGLFTVATLEVISGTHKRTRGKRK